MFAGITQDEQQKLIELKYVKNRMYLVTFSNGVHFQEFAGCSGS